MIKKGVFQFVIPAGIFSLLMGFLIIGPVFEKIGNSVLDNLGSDSICPEEFSTPQFRICFNSNGDVIADGHLTDRLTIKVEGTTNSCSINAGDYNFEFTGCKIEKFRQVEAYSVVLISSKGSVHLNTKEIISRIGAGEQIVKLKPKELSWIRRVLPFIKYFL